MDEQKFKQFFEKRNEEYKTKAQSYINNLDFKKLQKIKKKSLPDITQEDLEFLGFERNHHEDFEEFYAFQDFSLVKIYFNRKGEIFEKRGHMLRKEEEISTVEQLLDHSLTNWKLRLNNPQKDIDINSGIDDIPF